MVDVGTLDRARYLAQQNGVAALCALVARLGNSLVDRTAARPPRDALRLAERRYAELLERDLANVVRGQYPRELLFQIPWRYYMRQIPGSMRDLPRVLRRIRRRDSADLPSGIDVDRYPPYYRRNFHWQTDGWLSDRSARLYDFNVEVLFGGTADVMRRQAIPPLRAHLAGTVRPRVLDVACGTGRFLWQLHRAMPVAELYGLDLSPYYVARARKTLRDVPMVSLVTENAETMPFRDGVFDAASSVFLFHELPRDARRRVVREAARVLRPGGRLVICDSMQAPDAPGLEHFLAAFARVYHEPYYKGYLEDDLDALVAECGLHHRYTELAFVSKIVVADKPSVH